MHTKSRILVRVAIATNIVLASLILANEPEEVRTYSNAAFSEKALDKEVSTTTSLFELPVIETFTSKLKTTTTKRKIPSEQKSSNKVVTGDIWWRLALCESGGTNANTGNGFYGYFQFVPSTWRSVGGTGLPTNHGYEEQKRRAQILQQRSGWGQWPACSRKLGLR